MIKGDKGYGDIVTALNQIDEAQRRIAVLADVLTPEDDGTGKWHGCGSCQRNADDIKILLDGAYTRLREDVLGWEKEVH